MNFRNVLGTDMGGTEVLVHTRMLNTQDCSLKGRRHNLSTSQKAGSEHGFTACDTCTFCVVSTGACAIYRTHPYGRCHTYFTKSSNVVISSDGLCTQD